MLLSLFVYMSVTVCNVDAIVCECCCCCVNVDSSMYIQVFLLLCVKVAGLVGKEFSKR